jgi:hypothetical protein
MEATMEEMSSAHEADIEELAVSIAQALQSGRSQSSIVDEIIGDGQDQEHRENIAHFVSQIGQSVDSVDVEEDGGEFSSWMIWIALLVVINVLSAMFDWPFWVY